MRKRITDKILVDSLVLQHVNIELLMLVVWWCILSKAIIVAARGRVEAGGGSSGTKGVSGCPGASRPCNFTSTRNI